MSASTAREHDVVLRYLAALVLAVVTWLALRAMPFYPPWLEIALALTTGVIAVFSGASASLLFVAVLALPVMSRDLVSGIAFLLLGLIATQYLSVGRAGGFLLVVLGLAAIPLHAEWAIVAVAGYMLGRGKGALVGATICVTAIAAGVALGTPVLGTVATGGGTPGLITFGSAPSDPLGFAWLMPAIEAADPGRLVDAAAAVTQPLLLAGQVALWAIAAVVGASLVRPRVRALALVGPAAAVLLLAVGSIALDSAFGGPVATTTYLITLAVSLPVALLFTAAAVWLFPAVRVVPPAPAIAPAARDVDDLLRTIACAEDELAARHNTEAVVLITDMKSFSAMTEEIGSVESAKIVQRHRDLLLPIIAAWHGTGTATGGDGLVAAFGSAADAVEAAAAVQQALVGYTGSDRSPHELSVRVGVASGEVVMDTAGCPFLGAALNLAARTMDLADGGRIMITGQVAETSGIGPERLYAHGEFKLKNIAEAVPVVEVLWHDGLEPQEIRAT